MLNLFGKNVFARKRKAKVMPIDSVSRIETLEERVVPAAVTVSYSSVTGTMNISGSGDADVVNVNVSGTNQVQLTGVGSTFVVIVNGVSLGDVGASTATYNVSGDLNVSMGNGADTVNLSGNGAGAKIDSGFVNIDLGSGNDTLAQIGPSPLTFTSDLSVIGGTGSDTIGLGLTAGATDFVVANLTIDNGTDDNVATQSVTLNGMTANGNVKITNSGNALQSVVFGPAATVLKGNVSITQSGAVNTLGYSVTSDNAPVTGNLTIINGNTTASSAVDWATSNVSGTTTVINGNASVGNSVLFTSNTLTGNATVKNGTAATNSITVDGSTLNGKSSSFANGAATTTNTINLGLAASSTFAGVVSATNANSTGSNNVIVQRAVFSGSASLVNGTTNGTNTVTVGSIDTVQLTGNLVITNGTAVTANNVNIDRLTTLGARIGDVTINNAAVSAGTTSVLLGAAAANSINGNLTVRNQAATGTRTTSINQTEVLGRTGAYLYNVGAGNTAINVGTAVAASVTNLLKIQDGSGTANLSIQSAELGGLNFEDLGGGTDTINIGTTGLGTATVNGVTRLVTGAGSDTVNIGSVAPGAVFNDSVFITLGAGNDALNIGGFANSPAFTTANKFQFDGGAGVDTGVISPLSIADYEQTSPGNVFPGKKLRFKITNFENLS